MLCRLVAHHSCAIIEAEERGIARQLLSEFQSARGDLAGALIYCDMTTSPDGACTGVEERLSEIVTRYGPGHLVTRSIRRSAAHLTAAAARVTGKLAARAQAPLAA